VTEKTAGHNSTGSANMPELPESFGEELSTTSTRIVTPYRSLSAHVFRNRMIWDDLDWSNTLVYTR
jgi:hypothetical protein